MGEGYFDDGTILIALGEHMFATPGLARRNLMLTPHSAPAELFDSGGGILDVSVTGQQDRANQGDAERYAYEQLRALACSGPGTMAFEDPWGQRATFADSVCVDGLAEVRALQFVAIAYRFRSPEKFAEPAPAFPAPAAPAEYAGTDTLLDYAAGGVAIGHHAEGMRLAMSRDYPLREIPRARGARASGPRRGAVLRFTVRSYAAVTAQNLARYLEDLERQIGPRAVDLTGNGNTFPDVLLEGLRPAHTDRDNTAFEATFVQEVDCAAWTTTEGTTTSVAPTTTTHPAEPPVTTTLPAGTTTTAAAFTGSTTTGQSTTTTTVQGTTTTTEEATTTTAAADCDDCDPPVLASYCVTFAGLAGDFAAGNGTWEVERQEPDCLWLYQDETLWVELYWPGTDRYNVTLGIGAPGVACTKTWTSAADAWPCEPDAAYSELDCQDGGCFDANSCENSAGATCVVGACPTTTTAQATTTTQRATTTTAGATTTTEAPGCPENEHCADDCPEYVCTDDFQGVGCDGDCTGCDGTMIWQHQVDSCAWTPDTNPTNCSATPILCVDNEWQFTMQWTDCDGPPQSCDYAKPATPGSCPAGTYAVTGGDCADCPATVDVYAYGCHGQTTTTEEVTTTPSTSSGQATTTTEGATTTTLEPGSTTTLEPGSTTTCGPTDCNDCDPPICETLCVCFSGLNVDFAPANGCWPVDWSPLGPEHCRWLNFDIWLPGDYYNLILGWNGIEGKWLVTLKKRLDCWQQWLGGKDECDPSGLYTFHQCDDGACDSSNTCGQSLDAQCWVCGTCPCGDAPSTIGLVTVSSSTSTGASTTTQPATTTTAEGGVCPSAEFCQESCPADYYCDDFDGINCGGIPSCAGTHRWHRTGPVCTWNVYDSAGGCVCDQLLCTDGYWQTTMVNTTTGTYCTYRRGAADDCPAGNLSKVAGDCPDCPATITVYA